MKLAEEQGRAARHLGNTLLTACPGSEKTRTLVARLLRSLDDVRGTPRRIACITYTNAAVYEIEQRLRVFASSTDQDYCEISTIHAFCLNLVLRHFHWRIPEYRGGLCVLAPDSDEFREVAETVCIAHSLQTRARDKFDLLNREPNGDPIVAPPLTPEAAIDFWNRLAEKGYIDFPNIVYRTYKLLLDFPSIHHALACRFAHFLVDEFQDTSGPPSRNPADDCATRQIGLLLSWRPKPIHLYLQNILLLGVSTIPKQVTPAHCRIEVKHKPGRLQLSFSLRPAKTTTLSKPERSAGRWRRRNAGRFRSP